jgi:hypothetical protein
VGGKLENDIEEAKIKNGVLIVFGITKDLASGRIVF